MRKNAFTYSIKVTQNELDHLNHVNNVQYIQWVQNAAEQHWSLLSTSNFSEKYVWVVIRHEIDYVNAAILNDLLTINTWIGDSYGVKSERYVEIMRDSIVVAKAKTIWCLLKVETMKPIRIPSEILHLLETSKGLI